MSTDYTRELPMSQLGRQLTEAEEDGTIARRLELRPQRLAQVGKSYRHSPNSVFTLHPPLPSHHHPRRQPAVG